MTIAEIVKSSGIQRNLDELGRVVIPIEVRRNLGWEDKHKVEVIPTEGGVFIKSASYNPEKQKVVSDLNYLLSSTNDSDVYKAVQNALKYIGE